MIIVHIHDHSGIMPVDWEEPFFAFSHHGMVICEMINIPVHDYASGNGLGKL